MADLISGPIYYQNNDINPMRRVEHIFSQPDLIIAATGLCHGLTVVTRNTVDFEQAHVAVFNPWMDHA